MGTPRPGTSPGAAAAVCGEAKDLRGSSVLGGGEEARGLTGILATCRLRGENFLAAVTGALKAAVASAR
ncbi:hypothetical protein DRN74_06170 [Candidatus Micrarchaeota archaeon]|nr:MAG: hypothetical protein DRN74_06170 [Candidatus Micrarchaeota archaeon]